MKNLKTYLLLALIAGWQNYAQDLQNNNWVFGKIALLEFNNPPAITVPSGLGYVGESVANFEGCASVSDRLGRLILFSDGVNLWYRPDQNVPNNYIQITTPGNQLLGHLSSAQNVIFVPRPNHQDQYYIFTIASYNSGTPGTAYGLNYRIVDLNNGSPALSANIVLKDHVGVDIDAAYINYSEGITSTLSTNPDEYWLIAHIKSVTTGHGTGQIYSYRVTENAVGAAGLPNNNMPYDPTLPASLNCVKTIKVSHEAPDNTYPNIYSFAMTCYFRGTQTGTFNNTNGLVTLGTRITANTPAYGLEFSPNGQKMYFTSSGASSGGPLSRVNMPVTPSSTITTQAGTRFHGLQLAIDGNIYATQFSSALLYRITDPNTVASLPFISGSQPVNGCRLGLPQWVWKQQCEPILIDNDDIPASYQTVEEQRSNYIEATNRVNVDARLLYHAQNYIELLPTTNSLTDIGFEAVYGSEFEADIKPCGTPFSYRLSSGNGPGDDSDIKSQPSGRISVYPNPTNKFITISYGDALLKTVSIYSMDGKLMLVQQVNSNSNEADVSGYAKGVYLISAETADGKILKSKFVKN